MAEFEVSNSYTLPTGQCWASGTVILQISEITITPPQFEYVQLEGHVDKYGNTTAFGWLNANAKISNSTATGVDNESNVYICWEPLFPSILPLWNVSPIAIGNFTYSFYAAKLINTTMAALNYSGYDFYVSGLFTVYNVTFTYTRASGENWEQVLWNKTTVAQNVTGELMANGNWNGVGPLAWRTSAGNFTLSLAGFNDVTGSVERFVLHARAILDGDVLGHGVVDIYDLVYVARCIGDTPGSPQSGGLQSFEGIEKADLGFDFHIDIYDLVTVASELGQTG
jgi:hypothetical protein